MGLSPILPGPGEEEVKRPKLDTVPVLPAHYPLFDWDDWPSSYKALKPGTPTTRFEKECWNAIVDTLGDAMEAAGLDFYKSDEGFTPGDIHVTGGRFGVLTAEKMNNLLWAVEDVVPFEWPWENDVMHPGYSNRPDGFYGKRTNNKKKADEIYAQYILDIVHRINLIIQLMRDNYPYHNNVRSRLIAESVQRIRLRKCLSGPVGRKMNIPLLMSGRVRSGRGIAVIAENNGHAIGDFQTEMLRSAPLRIPLVSMRYLFHLNIRRPVSQHVIIPKMLMRSRSALNMESTRPVDFSFAFLLHSKATAEMGQTHGAPTEAKVMHRSLSTGQVQQSELRELQSTSLSASISQAEAVKQKSKYFFAENISRSKGSATYGQLKTTHTEANLLLKNTLTQTTILAAKMTAAKLQKIKSNTYHDINIPTAPSMPIAAKTGSGSAAAITVLKPRNGPMWVLHQSKTLSGFRVNMQESASVGAKTSGTTIGSCSIGSAWDPPQWHDGGLWIRQAKTLKIKPDGAIDLSGSGDPIGAAHNSETVVVVALGNAWLAPVWKDGGLYLRQVRQAEVMEDGSLDLTGAGNELLIQHRSKTAESCVLDTAWYPPVTVDGGLWIRQAQSVMQNDDKELEVR